MLFDNGIKFVGFNNNFGNKKPDNGILGFSIIISKIVSRCLPKVQKKKSFKYALNKIGAIAANSVDTNTVFTDFQICINIFKDVTIKSICREFCT